MKKRIVEIMCLVSFIVIFSVVSTNSQSSVKSCPKRQEITETIIPNRYRLLHATKIYDEQEQIRTEIMYGEVEMLAQLVEAEAGNQDELGKRYVADVVLNRVDSPLFPDTVQEVIFQDEPAQFSVTIDGALDKAGWRISDESRRVALEEYEGPRKNYDILYFTSGEYNSSGTPSFIYGNHYFSTR